MRRKIKLDPHAWASVENGYEVPNIPPYNHGDVLPKPLTVWTTQEDRDDRANTKAFDVIHDHLDMNMYQMIKNHTTAKGDWDALRRFFVGPPKVRASKIIGILGIFNDLRIGENDNCDEFYEKIIILANDLEELGDPFPNKLIIDKLFLRMNSKFGTIITALEQTEMAKTKDHTQLMARLKNYEMTHKDDCSSR